MNSRPWSNNEATADKVGVALGAATAVGIAAHAISTNIRKRKQIQDEIKSSKGGA